jgi:predicted PurR-regulated permease PerM
MTEQNFRYDLLTIIVLFLILSTVFIIYFPLVAAITLAITVAIVLQPLHHKLCERLSPAKSAALTTVIVAIISGFTGIFVVNMLIKGSGSIIAMIDTINQWLMSLGANNVISGIQIANTLESIRLVITSGISSMLIQVPGILFGAFILFLSVYLFLLKGQAIFQQIIDAMPAQLTDSIEKVTSMVANTMYAIYVVSVEVAIITFALSLPFYYLLGYPAALQLAIMSGLSMFIPILGPLIVLTFLVLYNLSIGNTNGVLIALFIIYPVVLWLPGSYIRSKLMGKRIGIHPVIMMIGILGGISVMGMIGLIIGPLFIALLVSSYQILIDKLTMIKNMSNEPTPK